VNRALAFLSTALVLAALLSVRYLVGRTAPDVGAVLPAPSEVAARAPTSKALVDLGGTRELLPPVVAKEDAPGVTFVKSYYGADSDAVLAKIQEAGIDLETLLPPTPEAQMRMAMPRWFQLRPDQREREYEGQWAWPAEGSSNAYLAKHFTLVRDLSPGELAALDALAASYEPEIHAAADSYFDTLDRALAQKVALQEYQLSPYVAWPQAPPPTEDGYHFRSTTKVGDGWVVRMALEVERFPEVIAARDSVHGASYVRDHDIAETLRMLTE